MKNKVLLLLAFFTLTFQAQNFEWAISVWGTDLDQGKSITVDTSGNIYTTGYFQGTAYFDPSGGPFYLTSSGYLDIFIYKLDASGNLVWAKQMGGTHPNGDAGKSIAVNASGNVYTTGYFNGTADFDPGEGTFSLTSAGYTDIFISKLDASGNFVWAKQMGGTSSDIGNSIAVDLDGNVYTTGRFQETANFNPGAGTFDLNSAGDKDIFISKLDASGNFVWAKQMGGTSWDEGLSIALDANGNVYTTGGFAETLDFDPGTGTFNLSSAGALDIFISKLDASGNFIWAKQMGGASFDQSYSIALDASGNIYTTGNFGGIADFDPGSSTFNLSSVAYDDIFISKLDVNGNFVWAKQMGGTDPNGYQGNSIVVDGSGNVYTTGYFNGSADFDPGVGSFNLTSAGYTDIFISKLDGLGDFLWTKNIGGTGWDECLSIALDVSGNVYTTGYFEETVDFDTGAGTLNGIVAGGSDIFVHKMSQDNFSIQDNQSNNFNLSIYPNPSHGAFEIDHNNTRTVQLKIIDVFGKLIYKSELTNKTSLIDLSHQAKGIYFVHLIFDNKWHETKKIIIH